MFHMSSNKSAKDSRGLHFNYHGNMFSLREISKVTLSSNHFTPGLHQQVPSILIPHLVIRFRQATPHMSDESQVVTSLLQLGESINNITLQAGEVTKQMERAKKRC